jgi:hypothetical protein
MSDTPTPPSTAASDTPRTDANLRGSGIRETHPFVEFTRQLERELADKTAAHAKLAWCLKEPDKERIASRSSTTLTGAVLAAVEQRIVEMIRFVGVKADVPEATYGAMCHEVRCILRSVPLDYDLPSAIEKPKDHYHRGVSAANCPICKDAERLAWLNLHWEDVEYGGSDLDKLRAAIDEQMSVKDGGSQ